MVDFILTGSCVASRILSLMFHILDKISPKYTFALLKEKLSLNAFTYVCRRVSSNISLSASPKKY